MEREFLIKKWLDGSLSSEEQVAFEALEDSAQLKRMSQAMHNFKAPEFNKAAVLKVINAKKVKVNAPKKNIIRQLLPYAAILIIALGITYFFNANKMLTNTTGAGQMATISLPDATSVTLNAGTSLSLDENNYDVKRIINLSGEAYFKVTKGATFTVETPQGNVTVLGTQFNVKQRGSFFEVYCYEGSVRVEHKEKSHVLKPGDYFTASANETISSANVQELQPSWITGKSSFKSTPYQEVLDEIERQFNVTITTKKGVKKPLFTGAFSNKNLDQALKTVTMPLKLKYRIDGKNIVIYNE